MRGGGSRVAVTVVGLVSTAQKSQTQSANLFAQRALTKTVVISGKPTAGLVHFTVRVTDSQQPTTHDAVDLKIHVG